MSREATITLMPQPGGDGGATRLLVWMAWWTPYGVGQATPALPNFGNAVNERPSIEGHYLDALRSNTFPYEAMQQALNDLDWKDGLTRLLRDEPPSVGLIMHGQTCVLLPELQPVQMPDGQWSWLDRLVPIVRRVGTGSGPRAPDQRPAAVAILYQEGVAERFDEQARSIGKTLRQHRLRVDLYPGTPLADRARLNGELAQIFLQHRIVLFLGHSRHPEGERDKGGWYVTPEFALPLQVLIDYLADKCRGASARPPELVLTICCSGAWGAPGPEGVADYFYPREFLRTGIRHFVGTWMDPWTLDPTWDVLTPLLTRFILGWHAHPGDAARALFDAKASCSSPLLASLFQLYAAHEEGQRAPLPAGGAAAAIADEAAASDAPAATVEAAGPPQPIQDNFRPRVRAGVYQLGAELWRDNWSVAYAASTEDGTAHVVQIPNDAVQADVDLEPALRKALRGLADADLGSSAGLLVADRVERLVVDAQHDLRALALVHDGFFDRHAKLLTHAPPQPDAADHFARVLEIGAEVALRLHRLHAAGLSHGRLDADAVIVDESSKPRRVMLKDAWLAQAMPGRRQDARYADPDAAQGLDDRSSSAADCYALGVLLYEFATGLEHEQGQTSVRERVGAERAPLVPEALERVVRGCLAGVATVRPPALQVARRLGMARHTDGTYLSDLAENFRVHLEAGHRLFAVNVDDFEELLALLKAMHTPSAPQPVRLYAAREGEGLLDLQQRRTELHWLDTAQTRQALLDEGSMTAADQPPDDEAEFNALELFAWIAKKAAASTPGQPLCVVAIDGARWWQSANLVLAQQIQRVMTDVHMTRGHIAIVIADRGVVVPREAAHLFCALSFPPLTLTELFERVLGSWSAAGQPIDEAAEAEAALIAQRLYPCGNIELRECLAICQASRGRIDRHVVTVRDELRAVRIGTLGTLGHIPAHKLPPFKHFGWPPEEAERLRRWAAALESGGDARGEWLVSGGIGCGKAAAARAIAALLNWPLFRLDARGCLRSGLGESEAALRVSLAMVSALGASVLLIDGLDRFVSEGPAANRGGGDATLTRMASTLSQWLDGRPSSVLVVATAHARSVPDLPAGWRRRFRNELALGLELPSAQSVQGAAYRVAVLSALFRRFRLDPLADDAALMVELAHRTCPDRRGEPLPSAMARIAVAGPMGGDVVRLVTGADIEAWMAETLLLWVPRQPPGAAETAQFWRNAAA